MQDFSIRLATPEDANAIKALRQRALVDHPDIFNMAAEDGERPEADYAALIKGSCILGAFSNVNQILLGHAQLAFHTRAGAKNRHKCELWWVYVRPEYRGHGLAKTLTSLALNLARKLDYGAVLLTVAAHNHAAITLYEQLGFIRYGCEPDMRRLPDGQRIDEVLMQCVL